MTSTMTADIEVDAPIRAVYDQWTQFEEFPEFMGSVNSITQTTDDLTHWSVSIGGVEREFDAEIVDQVPDDHIEWASTGVPCENHQARSVGARLLAAKGPSACALDLTDCSGHIRPTSMVPRA